MLEWPLQVEYVPHQPLISMLQLHETYQAVVVSFVPVWKCRDFTNEKLWA